MTNPIEFTPEQMQEIDRQVKTEYERSYLQLSNRKQVMRDREPLVTSMKKSDDKYTVNTVDGIIKGLLALYYLDELQVQAVGTNPYVWESGEERTNVFRSDYRTLNKEVTDWIVQRNRLAYGVGGYYFYGRDADNSTPMTQVLDTLSWRPDPNGHTSPEFFDWMGFDRDVLVSEVQNNDDFDLDARMMVTTTINDEQARNAFAKSRHREVNTDHGSIKRGTLYYHLTEYEGDCILHVSFFGQTLQCIKVDPINAIKKEKNNPYRKVRRPVSLNYFDPDHTPFGKSVFDYAENPQKLKSLIANLMKIKVVKQAMGGDYFIDSEVYKQAKSILDKPSTSTRIIPVNTMNGQPITNSVTRFPEEQISGDVYNYISMIESEVNDQVGLSKQLRGVDDGREKTATESANLQRNANVNLTLSNKVNSWGEKQYYSLMYIWYVHYFEASKKKLVTVNDGDMSMSSYVERKDIMDFVAPNIYIESKSVLLQKQAQIREQFEVVYAMDMQDPEINGIAKRYLQRHRKKLLLGRSKAKIDLVHPPSVEEMKAKRDIILLNRNIPVKVRDMNENHIDYITLYKFAMPTPARDASIQMRINAYIRSGQNQQQQMMQQQQGGSGVQAGVTNQLVSNAIAHKPQQQPIQ